MAEFFLQNLWADYLFTAVAGLIFIYPLCLIAYLPIKPVRKEKKRKFLLLNLGFIFLFSLSVPFIPRIFSFLLPFIPMMTFYAIPLLVIIERIIFAAFLFFIMYFMVRDNADNRKKLIIELALQSILTCVGYYLSSLALIFFISFIMAG